MYNPMLQCFSLNSLFSFSLHNFIIQRSPVYKVNTLPRESAKWYIRHKLGNITDVPVLMAQWLKLSANGLLGTGFTSQYPFQPRAGF